MSSLMPKPAMLAALAAATLAGGCTATTAQAPVDVTRFHLGQPMERTSIKIEPMAQSSEISPEFQLYADAVAAELERLGYARSLGTTPSGYIAAVSFSRVARGTVKERPPVSIGLGGGSYGSGVGLGGGVSFGIGGKTHQLYTSELWVQLRRRSDNTTVWEGRAVTQATSGTAGASPADAAPRLARALFKDFPGESGITITVK